MPRRPLPTRRLLIPRSNYRPDPCKRIAKQSGKPCKKRAVPGFPVCRAHGAGTPAQGKPGFYSDPTYIEKLLEMTDRRTSYLPDTLAERYNAATNDGELLALRGDLALIEVRLSQLLERVHTGESGDKWEEIREAIGRIRHCAVTGETASVIVEVEKAFEIIDDSEKDAAVWKEIMDVLDHRKRLAEGEAQRLVRLNQMIAAEDAVKLIERLLDAVKTHVKDPHVYSAIAYEFAVATGAAHRNVTPGGDDQIQPEQLDRLDSQKLLDP